MKKKLWLLAAAAVLCCAMLAVSVGAAAWNGTAASGFDGGTGAEDDPYRIATAEQLAYLAQSVNSGVTYQGKYIKLTADIELNDTVSENWTSSATQWTPIGLYKPLYNKNPFSGTFDGNHHTIRGLYINTTAGYQGIFGYTVNATFKNLRIEKASVTGQDDVGALAGRMCGSSIIENCINSGNVFADSLNYANAGGLVGKCEDTVIFTNCENSGNITSVSRANSSTTCNAYAGGIVGYCPDSATFINCTNSGTVSCSLSSSGSQTYAGGIVGKCGYCASIAFTNCSNNGVVIVYSSSSRTDSYAGGIAGYCGYSSTYTFTNCTNSNTVSSSVSYNGIAYAGGIAGICSSTVTITNCMNSGDISGGWAGGIVGYCKSDAVIRNCYNTGVSSRSGIAGYTTSGTISCCYTTGKAADKAIVASVGRAEVTACYYLSGSAQADTYGTVLTSAQMHQKESFEGFDFVNTWRMLTTISPFPVLRSLYADIPAASPVITVQPVSKECIQDDYIQLTVRASISDDGILSYQWYISNTAEAEGQAIDGAISAAYAPSTEDVGIKYYYVIITNTLEDSTASVKSDVIAVKVAAKDIRGICGADGNNLTWVLDNTGTLTISGNGKMADWTDFDLLSPWSEIKEQIKTVVITESVTSVGSYAFEGCLNLTEVTLPDTLTSIGNYAFSRNSFKEIFLPKSLTSIGDGAFQNNLSLEKITLPEGLTSIGEYSFLNCRSLTEVTFPNHLTSIGAFSFVECIELKTVTFPESLNKIGRMAFDNCVNLTEAYFYGNAPEADETAFQNTHADFTIYYPSTASGWNTPVWNGYPAYPVTLGHGKLLIGDLNADTVVDNNDLIILIRYFAGWNGYVEQLLNPDAADVNGDGILTRADAVILSRHFAGWNGYETLPFKD